MSKTVHPLLSHYSSTKWGEGRGGAYFKFRTMGGALIPRGHLFEGVGALNRRFTVIYISTPKISTSFDFRKLVPVKGRL